MAGGMDWLGIWTGRGCGVAFSQARNFGISEPETWRENRCFREIAGISLQIVASDKYFFGLWNIAIPDSISSHPPLSDGREWYIQSATVGAVSHRSREGHVPWHQI